MYSVNMELIINNLYSRLFMDTANCFGIHV